MIPRIPLLTCAALSALFAFPAHAQTIDDCSAHTPGSAGLPSFMPTDACTPTGGGADLCTIVGAAVVCDLSGAPAAVEAHAIGITGAAFHYMVFGDVPGMAISFCCLVEDTGSVVNRLDLIGTEWDDVLANRFDDGSGFVELISSNSTFIGRIMGSAGDDFLEGSDALGDRIEGGEGDDMIRGAGGDDTLLGDEGIDTISGGAGIDTIWGGADNDCLSGGDHADTLVGEGGDDIILGGTRVIADIDCETLDTSGWGEDGCDLSSSGDGADSLWGDDGDDQIWGCDGNDVIQGGDGSDALFGNDGNDKMCDGPDAYPVPDDVFFSGGMGRDQLRYGPQNHPTYLTVQITAGSSAGTGVPSGSERDLCDPWSSFGPNPIADCEAYKTPVTVLACDPPLHPVSP